MNKFDTIKEKVESFLIKFTDTRNSDKLLIIKIWASEMNGLDLKRLSEFTLKECGQLSTPSTITRVRAFIQNKEERLLPTDEKVFRERIRNSDKWKKWLREEKESLADNREFVNEYNTSQQIKVDSEKESPSVSNINEFKNEEEVKKDFLEEFSKKSLIQREYDLESQLLGNEKEQKKEEKIEEGDKEKEEENPKKFRSMKDFF